MSSSAFGLFGITLKSILGQLLHYMTRRQWLNLFVLDVALVNWRTNCMLNVNALLTKASAIVKFSNQRTGHGTLMQLTTAQNMHDNTKNRHIYMCIYTTKHTWAPRTRTQGITEPQLSIVCQDSNLCARLSSIGRPQDSWRVKCCEHKVSIVFEG